MVFIKPQYLERNKGIFYLEDLLSNDYSLSFSMSNNIFPGDIVINAGTSSDILKGIYNGKIKPSFMKEIYGIRIDKENERSNLSDIYKNAVNYSGNKKGVDRIISLSNSVYHQLFFRMMEYSDSYSKAKGILTPLDLDYLNENNNRDGKVFSVEAAIEEGPFLCHEFALTLYCVLNKEINNTHFKPFYVMGYVEKDNEKAGHCWIELENRNGKRFFLDRISDVAEFIDPHKQYFESSYGIKYMRDNGPLIIRI
jgi:hypothetical protein